MRLPVEAFPTRTIFRNCGPALQIGCVGGEASQALPPPDMESQALHQRHCQGQGPVGRLTRGRCRGPVGRRGVDLLALEESRIGDDTK